MKFKKKSILLCVMATFSGGGYVHAEERVDTAKVVVTATRVAESIASIPETMTILTQDEIQKQVNLSNGDLGSALGKLVPGFSVGNQSMSTYGQNLRGRKASVLVDGVPQNPIFDPGKNLTVIDPSMIERIEVIRGATAIYGDGATGGIINIITKKPTDGAPVNTTTLGVDMSLTHPGDSLGANVKHSLSGKSDRISYLLGAAIQKEGGWFDADGDRLVPNPHRDGGLSDTDQYNLFGKLGLDIDANQTVAANLNLFRNLQNTDYFGDPAQHDISGSTYTGAKARAVKGLYLQDSVGVQNLAGGLDYNHKDLWGSRLHIQVYHKDYWARLMPFFLRNATVYQDTVESRKTGGRIEVDTPLIDNKLSVLWGADYAHEHIGQKVKEMDKATYLSSGNLVFKQTGVERYWLSPYDQDNYAVFAQGELHPAEKWVLRAGVRHERIDLDIPTYTTLPEMGGKTISGGSLDYSTTLFNLGAVYYISDALNVYGNFSQGFSLPDVRQRLRRGSGSGTSVAQMDIQPEEVDNYELGIRGDWSRLSTSLAMFYNRSDLGASAPLNLSSPVVRAPEKVYGLEATLDWVINDDFKTGGTFTWTEGKQNLSTDALGYIYLNNQRIRPPKLTAYVEHRTLPDWTNRLQLLVNGHRDRFLINTATNLYAGFERPVSGYATLDWLSTVKLGKGTLNLGIENLLNRRYYTPQSQQFLEGDVTHVPGRGATLSASYSLTW